MNLILGIETSCDETGAALYSITQQKILAHSLFSQIALHKQYGGVVPEIASRSQLEKIDVIVQHVLDQAGLSMGDVDAIAVTSKPGLAGSLLVGTCFAKGLAWAYNKKIIAIDHLEGHVFSSFLAADGSLNQAVPFPHVCLTASGGHTSVYHVNGFGDYQTLGSTIDDAAGEAFDKIAKVLGYGYPGGQIIEELAGEADFIDYLNYPRTKNPNGDVFFSFSGLKTAVLYSLVKKGVYDLETGPVKQAMTPQLAREVASSLLVCIADIFSNNIACVLKKQPGIKAVTFVGGVACNRYIQKRLQQLCDKKRVQLFVAPRSFCTDNGAMIAFVGGYKTEQRQFSDSTFDIMK
ncbi:MAG: tRNA (adenosine(37)-N6)-threonylcarbamoyltransferase complex transferase subunit TsaD [Epsilonproteobacteria bacterium]|nr:tRNA (adenosine(37)-N6)-threonylcarbamoyltransferase complex transferase subunit TsaD [Campylobacterota bacterium]